jgi:hypothetical protein
MLIHLRIAVALVLGLCAAAHAEPAPRDVRDALAGTWTLVSIYEENDGGEELDRWGDDRRGRFVADNAGHFMLQLVGRNPIRLESPAQLRACARNAYESIGYAGTYSVDEGQDVLTLKIVDAIAPGFEGSQRTTVISLEGGKLHFRSAAEASPTGAFYAHLVWKRLDEQDGHGSKPDGEAGGG